MVSAAAGQRGTEEYAFHSVKPLQRIALVFGAVFALVIGQALAQLHGYTHFADPIVQKGGTSPSKAACELCAMAAQPSGMPVSGLPPIAAIEGFVVAAAFAQIDAPSRVQLVFRSRAPPVLL